MTSLEFSETISDSKTDEEITEEFRESMIQEVMSIGLPEDEAERAVDDYYGIF